MPTQPLNFAILGPGIVAEFHQQAIAANGGRLVAVGHYRPEQFAAISAKFGVPCQTEAELLARPDIDVLVICTPSGQHAQQTVAAARAGKHVLVEKPMALTLADADAMIAACEQGGVKLGVALHRRTEPLAQKIHRAIEAGDLGQLTLGLVTMPYFRGQKYYNLAEWRGTWAQDGGGVLMNQGIHIIDLLVWFMGDPIAVAAHAGTLQRNIEVEDTLAATLRFANGALATVTATTTAAPGFPHRIELYGSNGGIQMEGDQIERWSLVDAGRAVVTPPPAGQSAAAGAGADPRAVGVSGFTAIFKDFIEAIHTDRPPLVNGREGRRSLAAVLAIYQAAGLIQKL
ncbi:MAG: Myo-inositol 2-dehydrogenase [Anaerolineae bacterium]|nr:Myo-inositol 2-dehydrogenase [Anaerolineae bacterium]